MSNSTDPNHPGISGKALAACRTQGRVTFVGYLPVGYPDVTKSCETYRVLCERADMVEIGMPYFDPFLNNSVTQHATTRTLTWGVRTRDALTAAETIAPYGKTPVAMAYWNLTEQCGPDAFVCDLAAAGRASAITPDLTPDGADEWIVVIDAHGLDRIFLTAPSNTPGRIAMTMATCRGWVYATNATEMTGVRRGISLAAPVIVARARKIDPGLLIDVSVGIGNGDQVAEVGVYVDAVIVDSALMRCLADDGADMPGDLERLGALAAELLEGVRRNRRSDGHSCGGSTGTRM